MIKSERVPANDIRIGDTIMHWDRTIKIEDLEVVSSGFVFRGGGTKFMRRNGESVVRLKEEGLKVQIKKLEGCEDLPTPKYATAHSAGMDLYAAEDVVIGPQYRVLVSTGISVKLPEGYEMQLRPRSGLALKNGITLLNSPGTIDSDYIGPIKVILYNTDKFTEFKVNRGDRICQAVVAPVSHVQWEEVDELDDTERADGGFGSTGVA